MLTHNRGMCQQLAMGVKKEVVLAPRQLERAQATNNAKNKERRDYNAAFLRWVKDNVYCRLCGQTGEGLTFHHEWERRNGGKTLGTLTSRSIGSICTELMKGFFLCHPCHVEWHKKEFGEEPNGAQEKEI